MEVSLTVQIPNQPKWAYAQWEYPPKGYWLCNSIEMNGNCIKAGVDVIAKNSHFKMFG